MHLLNTFSTVSGLWDVLYARYLENIMLSGDKFEGRNGETRSLFGTSVTVDLKHSFPLTQLRKMPVKNLFREFLFDIGFDQNVDALGPARHFWDFLADNQGNLGASAYNRQWRMWPPSMSGSNVANETLEVERPVDQLQRVIDVLREAPNSRHGTVVTTNPTAINPACPPCHLAMQFMPRPDGSLDMMVPARSNDMVVGFPLDIARYAIMNHVIARAVDMIPGRVFMPSSNSHIYKNCYGIAEEIIERSTQKDAIKSCDLKISRDWDARAERPLELLELDYFSITGYEPLDTIKVAVN